LIVSSNAYNRAKPDVVVMAITSQLRPHFAFGEVWTSRWREAGLIKPSVVKPVFATLGQSLLVRQIGSISTDDKAALRQSIATTLM
jgi:mRNA interferase MazF